MTRSHETRFRGAAVGVVIALTLALAYPGGAAGKKKDKDAPPPAPAAPATSAAPAAAPADTASTVTSSTVAAVGLLPVHGILVDLDALPGVPDKPAKRGPDESLAALQRLWDTYLKGAGFNVLLVPVDVKDLGSRGAERTARLCEWSRQNNVRIAPLLIGAPEGQPLPKDYGQLAAAFVGKVIAALGPAGVASYSQIVFYQLDRPLNHPANHGAIEAGAASALLKTAAESIRAAEVAGLAQSGLQPSPLLVPGSFDSELIRHGAIAHTPISDEAYGQAYEGLRDYLGTVLAAAPVEAAAIEWFPGSVSSDGVDRLPDLMQRLQADLPGKLLIMNTGYSTAATSDTAQARYYALALNNLCDLRATQGVDSPFAGILWRSAVDAPVADRKPGEAPKRPEDLAAAWNDPKSSSREARSWWSGVQAGFGLLARADGSEAGLAPKTAYRVMSGLEAALAQSPAASDALAAIKDLGSGKGAGLGAQIKSRLQSAMFGMLDAWLGKTADNLFAPSVEAPPPAPGVPVPAPDVQIITVNPLPPSVASGTSLTIPVTLFNAGDANATNVAVYLRDKQSVDLAHTSPTSLSPGGTTTVTLTYAPSRPGMVQGLAVEAFCDNDLDPASNRADLADLKVEGGSAPPRPPRGFEAVKDVRAVRDLTLSPSGGSPSGGSPSGGTTTGGATTGGATMGSSGSGAGGGRTSTMTTQNAAGFVRIEAMSAPTVMMAPAPGGSGGASGGSSGGTSGTPRSIGSAPSPPPPPAPLEPVSMTLANPFSVPYRGVSATLHVDDVIVARRTLGTLMPGQRRTITFTEWKPPKPGTYRLRADLDGTGMLGKRLTSSATSTVTIAGGTVARTLAAPPAAAPPPATAPSVRPFAGTRTLTSLIRPASSQPVPQFSRPAGGLGGVRTLGAAQGLALSAGNILLRPFPPVAGQPVQVSVQLANPGRAPIQGARVRVHAGDEPLGEVVVDVPASGVAVASGFKDWAARPGRHDLRATVVAGTRTSEAVKLVFVNAAGTRGWGHPARVLTAGMPGAGGPPEAPGIQPLKPGLKPGFKPGLGPGRPGSGAGPDLQVTAADIRFAPAIPASGAAFTVAITVRNLGSVAASNGRVLAVLTAAGAEVARHQFAAAVPPQGVLVLEWPLTAPAATPLVVTATASATGDTQAANNQARATAAGTIPVKVLPQRIGVISR